MKVFLDTTTSITTTYAGEFAGKYIAAALLSGDTLGKGRITIRPNVKYKEVVKKLATASLIANATCDFTDTGTVTLTERILQPEEFQVNVELCKKDFRSDWEAVQMGYSVYDQLPPKFADFLLMQVAASVAEQTEETIWHGVNATAGEFAGFVVLMTADGSVVDVASPAAGGITSSNVVAELGKIADAIPTKIYGKEDTGIYIANNVARAYVRALGANHYLDQSYVGDKPLNFDGIPLWLTPGLEASYMVAAQKSNLWFGTGLMADSQEVKVLDMAENDGSQNVRIIMRYTSGIQYGISEECVLYTPGA